MSWDETEPIRNSEDTIDSREIIARIRYLESEDVCLVCHEPIVSVDDETDLATCSDGHVDDDPLGESDREELRALKALADEGEGLADWEHGETLVRDSYFEQYAEELADDIGAINKDAGWPLCHIDWEAAADALRQDYTEIDFDGVAYWARS